MAILMITVGTSVFTFGPFASKETARSWARVNYPGTKAVASSLIKPF